MNKELTIDVCGESLKLQLQSGFFDTNARITPIHDHRYTEIQIVGKGRVDFGVGDETVSLEEGELLIVPSGVYHSLSDFSAGARRVAFQVTKPVRSISRIKLPGELGASIVSEVKHFYEGGKTKRLTAYLALVCAELFEESEPPLAESTDRAFLIEEYFSKNYNDPEASLDKISAIVGVSKKQAEREIFKATGNNFRTELSLRRIRAAKLLMDKGDKSLSEVAEEVGYRSYSGFWKAFGKFESK